MPQTPLFGPSAFFKEIARPEFSKPGLDRQMPEPAAKRTAFNDALSSAQSRARDLAETVQQRRAEDKRLEERRLEEQRTRKDDAQPGKTDRPEKAEQSEKPRETEKAAATGTAKTQAVELPAEPAVSETDAPNDANAADTKAADAKAAPVATASASDGEAAGDVGMAKAEAKETAGADASAKAVRTGEQPAQTAEAKAPPTQSNETATEADTPVKADKPEATDKPVAMEKPIDGEKPVETAQADARATEKGSDQPKPDASEPRADKATTEVTAPPQDANGPDTAKPEAGQAQTAQAEAEPKQAPDRNAAPAIENAAETPVDTADGLAAAKDARAAIEAERYADADTPYVAPTARGDSAAGSGGSGGGGSGTGGPGGQGQVQAANGAGADGQGQPGQHNGQQTGQQNGQNQARSPIDPALLSSLTSNRSEAVPVSPPTDFRAAMTQASAQAGSEGAAKTAGDAPAPQTGTQTALGQVTPAATGNAAKAAEQARLMMAHRQGEADTTKQVAAQIRHAKDAGLDKFKIKLNPVELGAVDIELEVAKDGKLKALIVAEKPETLESLQRDARTLEKALTDAGLKTDQESLEFSLQDPSRQADRQFAEDRGRSGGNGRPSDDTDIDLAAAGPVRRLDALVDVSI